MHFLSVSVVTTLGLSPWIQGLLTFIFLLCSLLLVLTVLIQRPQGGGLAGAFGAGAGSGETAFGARTGDALTIATISFFIVWLLAAVGLVYAMRPSAPSVPPAAVSTDPATLNPGAADEGAAPQDEATGTPPTSDTGATDTPPTEAPSADPAQPDAGTPDGTPSEQPPAPETPGTPEGESGSGGGR